MLGDWREMVTGTALTAAVGPDVLDRARPYVSRSVLDVRLADDARRLTGLVQGGAPAPYRTSRQRQGAPTRARGAQEGDPRPGDPS